MRFSDKYQSGFTLIEAIMVMTITAVLAAGVAVFLRKPIDGYMDLARRTELSDIADTTARRITRDLHLALPNSVRMPSNQCMEFLPTINGGRYRADVDGAGGGNVFSTATSLAALDVLGDLSATPANGDFIVIYNLGITGANAYAGDNRATVGGGTTVNSIVFSSLKQFPLASPGNRFHVLSGVEQAVAYVCTAGIVNGNGTGTLFRASAYGINATEPSPCPATPVGTPILAQNISQCQFTYSSGVTERSGLVSIRLGITKNNETVNLYQDVHVNNVP
ncbi:MAG: prepilin-type N-terminal cleavage/methylation domain-containing protein [Undibacterium sp.]|nr:prepilin-type N-terminal cleavage/methylation domain-containing protein [Undibacterium sp.]